MKVHMKRQLRAFLLAMLCIVLVIPAMNVSAATQRQKAIAAYKKYLSQTKVYLIPKGQSFHGYDYEDISYYGTPASKVSFCFLNIDNDGVPELIVSGYLKGEPIYTVLTYKNGKICRASSVYGSKVRGYYPKTGIYLDHGDVGATYETYYRLKGVKASRVMDKYVFRPSTTITIYSIGSNEVSARTFAAKRKSITGGKTLLKAKFYKNTAENRKLRLK